MANPELPASASSASLPASSDPVAHTLALLRPWIEYVPQQQRRLGLFILIALLVHMAVFFFIRIDNPRAELQHQTRIRVSVESPQAVAVDGQRADDFWNRLTDPRLYLMPSQPAGNSMSDAPSLDFTSINPNVGSPDLPPSAAPEDYRVSRPAVAPLEQRVTEAMDPPRQPFVYNEAPPVVAANSTWQWDTTLADRHPTGLPALPSPVSETDLSPTELSVAVASDGSVEHVLVEQSSGDLGASTAKDLDQQAVRAARKIRFQPSDQPGLMWGRLTVFWHYSAKPRDEVVPTPPSAP
jgi:TonB family protein